MKHVVLYGSVQSVRSFQHIFQGCKRWLLLEVTIWCYLADILFISPTCKLKSFFISIRNFSWMGFPGLGFFLSIEPKILCSLCIFVVVLKCIFRC